MNYRVVLSKMIGASFAAQIIALAFIPLMSRLYSPSDFAEFAVLSSIGGLIGGVLALKQEQLLLSREKVYWAEIFRRITFFYKLYLVVSILLLFGSLTFFDFRYTLEMLLVMVFSIFTNIIIVLSNLGSTEGRFNLLAASRLMMSLTLGVGQAILAIFDRSHFSLMIGMLLSQLVFIAITFFGLRKTIGDLEFWQSMDVRSAIKDIKSSVFLVFSSATLSTATGFLPIFLVVLGFKVEAGVVSVLQRFMLVPVNLLSAPLSQTFVYYLKSIKRSGMPKKVFSIIFIGVFSLYVLSYFFVLLLEMFSVFEIVLGEEWRLADQIASMIVSVYFSLLVKNLINQYFIVKARFRALFVVDVTFIFLVVSFVLLMKMFSCDFFLSVIGLSLIYILYVFYGLVSIYRINACDD